MAFMSDKAKEERRSQELEAAEEVPVRDVFRVTVQDKKFHNPETGFFIVEGSPAGPVPILPGFILDMGVRAPTHKVVLIGTSQAFVGTDQVGSTIECVGNWAVGRHGLQFAVDFVQDVFPTTPMALEKYLSSLKFIGPSTAREIVNRWGLETIRILDHTPSRLLEISGLNETKITDIEKGWKEKRESFEVVAFLGQHGIGESVAQRVRDHIKENVREQITRNPYLLTEVEGIGFQKADAVALSLGFPSDSPQRTGAALQYSLQENVRQNGHTAIPVATWLAESVAWLRRPREEILQTCQRLVNGHKVVVRKLPVTSAKGQVTLEQCVSPLREARFERSVAVQIKRLMNSHAPVTLEENSRVEQVINDPERRLDPSQKVAGLAVFQSAVSVLTGGPGTGKTTTLRTIVAAAQAIGWTVVLAAPTGRAAKRMEEAIGMESMTMHRRLGFVPGTGFKKNEDDPLAGNLFVLDETSMVETGMMSAWLRALPSGATVLFVGDSDQLPSVGAGDVLSDFIKSERIPVARLTRVHRQAEGSGIAWNAAQVKDGRSPSLSGDPWRDDFAFLPAEDDMAIRTHLVDIVEGLLRQGIAHSDIQILCPQRKQDCGTMALNDMLRGLLNPTRPDATRLGGGLCEGERLMQTKNNYDLEVFNGDMGTIKTLCEDGAIVMTMDDGREVKFPKQALKDLEFGYAITVHKSQGGERPVIIMPISTKHSYSLNRNLLYTGITRGKNRVILIGSGRTAVMAAKKKSELVRITGLLHEMEQVGIPRLAAN